MPENSKKTLSLGSHLHSSVNSSWSSNIVYVKSVSPVNFTEFLERKQSCQIILFHSKSRTFFFPGFFVSAFKDRNRIRKWEKNQFTWTVGLKLGRRICSLSNKLKIRCFDWFARLCNFLWKLWPKNLSLVNSLLCSTQLKTALIPCYYQ